MAEAQGSQETIKVFEVKIKFTDEGVQRVVRMTTDSIDKAKAAVASYDNTLEGFQATVQETSRAIGNTKGSAGNPSGLAAALTQELGRGISDAQYGMIGMANNMSQFATLAGALTAKTGTMKAAFQAFGQALIGPNGVIVGINLLITLMPQIIKLFNKTEEAAKKLEETLNKTAEAEISVTEAYVAAVDKRIKLAEAQGASEGTINKLFDERRELLQNLRDQKESNNKEDEIELRNLVAKKASLEEEQAAYEKSKQEYIELVRERGIKEAAAQSTFEQNAAKEAERLAKIDELRLEQLELSEKIAKDESAIMDLRVKELERYEKAEDGATKAKRDKVKKVKLLDQEETGAYRSMIGIRAKLQEEEKQMLIDGTKDQAEAVKERIKLMQELLAVIDQFNKDVAKAEAEQTRKQKKEFEARKEEIERFIEGLMSIGQGLSDLASAQADIINSRADLEIEKERELMNAKMAGARTTQEKAKIEENYEKKVRAINERRIKDELKAELLSLKIKAATTLSEMAISQSGALVDLFKGKQKTEGSAPYPANIPLVAGYLLSAFATFKQMKAARMKAAAEIKSLAPGAGGPSGGGTGASFSPNFNLVGNTGANQLKDAIDNSLGEQNKEPVKAYVVLDELNAANDMKRQSESSSTL